MKLIKLHYKYLFSKFNILTITIIILIITGGFLLIINPFSKKQVLEIALSQQIYFQDAFLLLKLALTILFSLIISNSFLLKNDNYNTLYLSYEPNRLKYFTLKVVSLKSVCLLIGLFVLVLYHLIGYTFTSWFTFSFNQSYAFIIIIIISLIYGSFASILSLWWDNVFCIIIPFLLLLIGDIISDGKSNIIQKYYLLFPNIILDDNDFYLGYGIIHLIFLVIIYFFISLIIYLLKDFN